jgi:hypothetical protein
LCMGGPLACFCQPLGWGGGERTGRAEGPPKEFDGPPRAFAKSQTHPPAVRLLFP